MAISYQTKSTYVLANGLNILLSEAVIQQSWHIILYFAINTYWSAKTTPIDNYWLMVLGKAKYSPGVQLATQQIVKSIRQTPVPCIWVPTCIITLHTSPGAMSSARLAITETLTMICFFSLLWRHNGRDGVSNHQPHDCLPKFHSGADQRKHQSSASLAFVGRIPPTQMASNAGNVSIWWRHHGDSLKFYDTVSSLWTGSPHSKRPMKSWTISWHLKC